VNDYIIWYAKNKKLVKYLQIFGEKDLSSEKSAYTWLQLPDGSSRRLSDSERTLEEKIPEGSKIFRLGDLTSQSGVDKTRYEISLEGKRFTPHPRVWATSEQGMKRLIDAGRIQVLGSTLAYIRFFEDFPVSPFANLWTEFSSSVGGQKIFVVQTHPGIIERCLLMSTDPGDLVLDPTCGSGTTAYVAEQWGRRWITCDTSRIAITLAKQRLMTALFDYYELAHPEEGVRQRLQCKDCSPNHLKVHRQQSRDQRGHVSQGDRCSHQEICRSGNPLRSAFHR
jgi:adenine-specific DNA-methyltransferase